MSYLSTAGIIALTLATMGSANAQSSSGEAIPVGVDNFARAESDLYMGNMVADGGLGRFVHSREPVPIDAQSVIRMNRDTLYSSAVFDLDAGPVTITLPEAGERFMSMLVVNEDHYVPAAFYGAGDYALTREKVGTRYAFVAVRTLVDPADPKDLEEVRALQDAIKVSQVQTGEFVVPKWDPVSQKKVRDALLVLGSTLANYNQAFGTASTVDPVQHLIGTASGWGGNPSKDAIYLGGVMPKNDGKSVYRLRVGHVPVKGFWSVSVYNEAGYFEKNPYGAYSLNNLTAKKSEDGSIMIQFGGCDGKMANCLPTMPGWNYTVRLYQPEDEVLNGQWHFPQPQLSVD
ncbi:Protein of uncharacterised function (DUF1214) [Serratia entomophila]|uniref:DUF1254 domain-containing protein n=1 Tax=Serratia entomophila TaxID=42906 RepID=UPI0021779E53|nr:DUF1254 domain-containing protein [Serratia entomophila]CAI0733452.1 Protein of uncharacterised function (DUF1214) [Serratia entomophila]CAI1571690.1 Protein of uncharacterised function (DUF1214) [Serratia entomophila]CAI1610731.1 Protein of uncharacterised function (DUF1214) [Serratia entomophila]CAI1616362.1 Protein of uncharacterised function (DUF1214) [Serratia entomophila]CAI1945413.1 Protein of uncharacterised function (DUF1214) [Serratia entomophila]